MKCIIAVPFHPRGRQIAGNTITYLGNEFRWFGSKRRPLPAVIKGGAFVEDASGRWFVCLQVELEDERPTGAGEIGIDLGLKSLAVTSEGERLATYLESAIEVIWNDGIDPGEDEVASGRAIVTEALSFARSLSPKGTTPATKEVTRG